MSASHSPAYIAGYITGIMVGILFLVIIVFFVRKRLGIRSCKENFDERQQAARGIAYKWGFFTLLIYQLISMLWDEAMGPIMEQTLEKFFGVVVAITVFAIISIMKDAYVGLYEKRKTTCLIFGLIAVVNLLVGVRAIVLGELTVKPVISCDGGLNLLCGILLVIIVVAILVKSFIDKKQISE